jgi:hypothetical protein
VLVCFVLDFLQLFKANSTLDKACQALGDEAVKLIPQLEKQIDTLAWDSSVG